MQKPGFNKIGPGTMAAFLVPWIQFDRGSSPILVGGIPIPLKNIKVSCDDDIPNILKNKKCSVLKVKKTTSDLNF
jgi:hypothetical protein